MTVTVNDQALRNAVTRLSRFLGDSHDAMAMVGQLMTTYVQDTIRGGGRKRPYAPLSPWTTQRTGRSQPLITLVDRFAYSATRDTASIYFLPPTGKNFSITQHHRGFTTPARIGKLMAIPISGGVIFTHKAKKSVTPAREVWPTQQETSRAVRAAIRGWVVSGVGRTWR